MIPVSDGAGRIVGLTLSGDVIDGDYLARVAEFPKLKTLTLSHIGADPATLAKALEGSSLTTLRLGYGFPDLDEEALKKLAAIPTLKVLSVISSDPEGQRKAVRAVRPDLSFAAQPDPTKVPHLNRLPGGSGKIRFEMGYRF